MMIVKLTKSELMVAGLVGNMRSISSLGRLVQNKHSPNDSQWQIDVDGAAAEMAFAKWMNVYYEPTLNTFKDPDVGRVQIRSTKHEHGKLIVRDRDVKNEIIVLVINAMPEYRMAGWIYTDDAKQDKYIYDPNSKNAPAWMVPQSDLNKMEDLDVTTLSAKSTRQDNPVDQQDD
jgi:hypothetical protein